MELVNVTIQEPFQTYTFVHRFDKTNDRHRLAKYNRTVAVTTPVGTILTYEYQTESNK